MNTNMCEKWCKIIDSAQMLAMVFVVILAFVGLFCYKGFELLYDIAKLGYIKAKPYLMNIRI